MTDTLIGIVGLLAALALNWLGAVVRASWLNSSVARMLAQGMPADPRQQRILDLLRQPARLQITINLFQNLVRFLILGLLLFLFSTLFTQLSVLGITLLLFLAALGITWLEWFARGQVIPNAEAWAVRYAWFTWGLMVLLKPFVSLGLQVYGDASGAGDDLTSGVVDELKTLVDAGQQEGVLEQGERKMIYSIFELGDTLAREIMVPRIDVTALDVHTPLLEAVDALLESGYTRVPVYEETIDNILGLVYAKDLLRLWRRGEQLTSLRDVTRPAYFVPEAKKVDELMAEMQAQRIHMAIVVDEYGGMAGLVSLEDIVEEILGEIHDEYDQGEELPFVALPDGEYLFQARVDLDDFNEVLGSSLSKEEAETVGGFMYSQIGRVPASGEQVRVDDILLTVDQVSGRRIRSVRARHLPVNADSEEPVIHVDE